MQGLLDLFAQWRPASLAPYAALLLIMGSVALLAPGLAGMRGKSDVKRRLRIEDAPDKAQAQAPKREAAQVHEKAAKQAQEFYAKTDPENVARLRLKLIQAGYMDPGAVGRFFLIRFVALGGVATLAFLIVLLFGGDATLTNRVIFIGMLGAGGYFLPGFILSRQIAARMREYRNGFPDFMDLMIVCSDAGMSMEAAIERVSRELSVTHPALSQNLQLVSIELRAGRALDDALKSLADRLSLDEVRSFATLLQQSRELGTSLSGALRVFSDEMRHKRMSLAEEKAHALPAKMSVPVTVCILPVVMMVAIIPVIVKMTGAE
ncbi:MAG: type II secretion system F family protein [Rhizobiaceae bacterium]|nr:type II secretion system F family protein [Rhizobiaceae bacterium]